MRHTSLICSINLINGNRIVGKGLGPMSSGKIDSRNENCDRPRLTIAGGWPMGIVRGGSGRVNQLGGANEPIAWGHRAGDFRM